MRYAVLTLVVGMLTLGVAAILLLVSARGALFAGEGHIESARQELTFARVGQDPVTALHQARAELLAARNQFREAQNRLSYVAPIVTRLSWVPIFGGEVAASPSAARLANESSDGALSLVNALAPLLSDFQRHRGERLSVAAALKDIRHGRAGFERACGSFDQAEVTRRAVASYSSASLAQRLATFDRVLPELRLACRTLVAIPALLGLDHPFRYLIAYQDPEQLRATGGFIGSAGLLTLYRGQPSQHFISTGIRDNLSVPPPDPVALYDGEPGWLLRDSNWSPNFPTTAALERFFAKLDLGWNVSAVIDITPQAVADALQATGGFYSPEYHRWITASNVARLADYYTHRTRNFGPLRIANEELRRKQFIAIVANHLFTRVTWLRPQEMLRLARAIGDGFSRRDILVNFGNPQLQQLLEMAGATGAVRDDTSDFLYVVDSNLSYNKVNPYVHLRIDYRATILRKRWLQATITLHFRNVRAPQIVYADGYGPGAGRAGTAADYSDFVRILVPKGAEILNQSGWVQPWTSGPAYGKTMLSGYVIVRVDRTREVRISYIVPPNVFSWSGGKEYRLVVQHQPGSVVDTIHVDVTADGKTILARAVHHPVSDWTTTAPILPRPIAPIPLSRSPAPVVSPGHWMEPHAYLGAPKK
jgi:hypothetical protein